MTPSELRSFHEGDEELFARLVAAHSPQLLAVAVGLTGDRVRAHELVHDTWVRAFEKRTAFSGSGSLVGWMIALMRTCLRSEQRTDARSSARAALYSQENASDDPGESVLATIDESHERARLWNAIAGLAERQRDVVVIRMIEQRTVAETAVRLGIAEGTVKATLSQAMNRLRALLKEKES
jgi:RNA polymerase sigma-70 factor, ECF subfamily